MSEAARESRVSVPRRVQAGVACTRGRAGRSCEEALTRVGGRYVLVSVLFHEPWAQVALVEGIEYGFSYLEKQNKKAKNCAVFCFAGKRFFFIYEVITWEKRKKSSAIQ